jgi:hypothetical protein
MTKPDGRPIQTFVPHLLKVPGASGSPRMATQQAGIDDPASGYLEAFCLDSAGSVFHMFHDDGVWESETLGNTDSSGATVTLAWL